MNLQPAHDDIARVLEPYIVERMPVESGDWQGRRRTWEKKWRRKLRRRRLFGWLPSGANAPRWLRGRRTQQDVEAEYEKIWSVGVIPAAGARPDKKPVAMEWKGEGMLVQIGALPRIHLMFMAEAIAALKPKRILEVGSGDGRILLSLASRLPGIEWTGVELTQAGVDHAQSLQRSETLPNSVVEYMPWPVEDADAYRTIDFRQGNAVALPFEDKTFDMVITHQALEQMEEVREAALSEIVRVAKSHVLFVEPFADFNTTELQRTSVAAKDYFTLSVDALASFGIEPLHTTGDFPQKVRLGQGVVVGTVS